MASQFAYDLFSILNTFFETYILNIVRRDVYLFAEYFHMRKNASKEI